jgi:hypothetical protein
LTGARSAPKIGVMAQLFLAGETESLLCDVARLVLTVGRFRADVTPWAPRGLERLAGQGAQVVLVDDDGDRHFGRLESVAVGQVGKPRDILRGCLSF